MIRLMKKLFASASSAILYGMTAAMVYAQDTKISIAPPQGALGPNEVQPNQIPQFLISFLFVIGVVAAIAYLIWGGVRWIFSRGDKTAVDAARQHIVASLVGLIVMAAAFVLINAVFFIVTGRGFDLNHLCIPTLKQPYCP